MEGTRKKKAISFYLATDLDSTFRKQEKDDVNQDSTQRCDCKCKQCSKLISELQSQVKALERRVYQHTRVEQFQEIRLEKREQLLNHVAGRFRDQSKKNDTLQTTISKIRETQEESQNFAFNVLGGVEYQINGQNYTENQISFRGKSKITTRQLRKVIGDDNSKRFITKSLSVIHNQKYEQEKEQHVELETLEDLMKKGPLQLDTARQPVVRVKSSKKILVPHPVKIVSENQGAQFRSSFFSDDLGRFSFFDIEDKDKSAVLDKLTFLSQLLGDEKSFMSRIERLNPLQQREIGLNVQYLITDLKHFIGIGWRLKRLVSITTEMIRHTNLLDTYQAIIDLSCQYLRCDRLSIFILDKAKRILWTKGPKSLTMIEVPIDRGIVGYAVTNNIKINVPDAYRDERFNQEIDKQTGYKTKGLLVVPMNDEKGQAVGALQAINKEEGNFNQDDEVMLSMIAQYCGGIIKNSLLFEDSVLKLQRMKKLLTVKYIQMGQLAMRLYEYDKVEAVIEFAQRQICEMLAVQRCLICLVTKNNQGYTLKKYHYKSDARGNMKLQLEVLLIQEINSLLSKVIFERRSIFLANPGHSKDYNPQQDIQTTLSLITLPVFSSTDERMIAVIQVETIKGFVAGALGTYREDDMELLQLFSTVIGTFLSIKFSTSLE